MKKIRLVLLFWLCYLTSSWSQSLETRIDFSIINATIVQALNQLSAEQKIDIAYSSRFFPPEKRVTINLLNTPVKTVLGGILKGVEVDYQLIESQIILSKKVKTIEQKYILSGYISHADSGERLIAASVYDEPSGKWCLTNEYGFFSLKLSAGPTIIRVTYLGTKEIRAPIEITKTQKLNFEMEPSTILAEVLVIPKTEENQSLRLSAGPEGQKISQKLLNAAPDLGGQSDVLRTAQLIPGVSSGVDGFGGMFVRGGDSGQNLMLLDGVPIYNPFHLLGIFSIYNSNAIRNARLLRGGFPARYGGRVSSVFDVHMREGNNKKWSGSFQTNLLSANASIEGPLLQDKATILLTVRRSHLDVLLKPALLRSIDAVGSEGLSFSFYDFSLKFNYKFSAKDRLFVSYYESGDFFSSEEEEETDEFELYNETELEWGNKIGAIRWNHLFGPDIFSNTTLTFSRYNYRYAELYTVEDNLTETESFVYFDNRSNNKDIALKTDFDYLLSPTHTLRFGGDITAHQFQPIITSFDQDDGLIVDTLLIGNFSDFVGDTTYNAIASNLYFEDDWQIFPNWRVNFGSRLSYFSSHDNARYFNFEPRISSRLGIAKQLSFNASLARMVQYLHLISDEKIRTPSDVWLPSDEDLKPQESWQIDGGLHWRMKEKWNLSLEGYYKKVNHIQSIGGRNNDDVIEGKAWAYGMELMAEKQEGKTGGWMSYTLSWSNRQFPQYNLGIKFPFRYDRRHQLKLYLYHQLSDHLMFSANWIYESANPQVLVYDENELDVSVQLPEVFGEENLSRGIANHRLDFTLSYQMIKNRFQHSFKLGIYNVYNRKNAAFYRLSLNNSGMRINEPVHLMPFMPSLSYQLKF